MAKRRPINSGELNQKIEIFINADVDDGAGGTIPGIELYWATNAKVDVLKSVRTQQANQETLKPAVSFTVRNRDDKFLVEDMILHWRGQDFAISSADPDYTYKQEVVIIARAVELPQR